MAGLESYAGKHVLVTGGSGFLGRHLVAQLRVQDAVVYPLDTLYQDLTRPFRHEDLIPHNNIDLIFHLAAKVAGISANRRLPFDYMRDNSLMATYMVDYALQQGIPIVAAGSVCVYSNDAPLPFIESNIFMGVPERSNYGYGLSKRYLLQLLTAAALQDSDFRYAYVNSANLYGPGDNFGSNAHVIPDLIRKVHVSPQNGNKIKIMGTGRATRDFLYVGDAAAAYLRAGSFLLDNGIGLVCNIGSGCETTILDVLHLICEQYDFTPEVVSDGMGIDGQPRRLVNIGVAKSLLDWQPTTSLRQGIEKTVAWYKKDFVYTAAARNIRRDRS